MSQHSAASKYAKLPKVELHIHADGSCRLSTLQELSRAYNLPFPHDDLERFRGIVSLTSMQPSLKDFLNVFTDIGKILCTKEALERVAYELVEDLSKQNVVYAEVRFYPFSGVPNGVSGDDFALGIIEGLERGEKDFGVKVRTIFAFMREKPEYCQDIVKLAGRYRDRGVVGVDIAGDELLPFKPQHLEGFKEAQRLGFNITVHAAESGPASNVKQAIEELGAMRIGHGYRVLEDETIYRLAREKDVHFETCPTSSLYTNAATISDHAIIRFAADGTSFSLSTDDPGVCPCTLTGEFDLAAEKLGLSEDQLIQSVINGARASFLPPSEKDELLKTLQTKIDQYRKETSSR